MRPPLTLALASIAAIGVLSLSPASAAPAESAAKRVSYADLNLENEAGAEAMLRRIRQAARQVCGEGFGRIDLRRRAEIRRCTNEVVEEQVAEINRPALSAAYDARAPRVTIGAY